MIVNILVDGQGFEYIQCLVKFVSFGDGLCIENGEEMGCTYHRVKMSDRERWPAICIKLGLYGP